MLEKRDRIYCLFKNEIHRNLIGGNFGTYNWGTIVPDLLYCWKDQGISMVLGCASIS